MTAPPPPAPASDPAVLPQASLATLRDFGMCLLALVTLARAGKPEDMHHDALQALRALVPFDAAWWGEVSRGTAEAPPRNWLHGSIGLSASFAEEWNALSAADVFAEMSIARLGEVIRGSGDDVDPQQEPPGGEIDLFCRRHLLYHAMAITLELPASGLMFFVALYRRPGKPNFPDAEAVIFGEFARHLVQHWRDVLEGLQGAVPGRSWEAYALADLQGRLVYVGGRIGQVLREADPGWQGTLLPAELAAAMPQAPCSVAVGRADRLTLVPCGRLVALVLDAREQGDLLPPRERRAATLYAQGRSYKEIAGQLELSPATVRTYLRNVYANLGVRNKIELLAALRQ